MGFNPTPHPSDLREKIRVFPWNSHLKSLEEDSPPQRNNETTGCGVRLGSLENLRLPVSPTLRFTD